MLKRILRIEPPYLAAIIFVIGVNYPGTLSPYSKGGDFHINYFNLLLHFGYLNSFFNQGWLNPVFWTLAIEFQFYLLMGLIYPLINSKKKYIQVLILISLLISTYLIKASGLIFHFLPYFILGIILFYRKTKQWPAVLCTFAELLIITLMWYTFSRVEFFATIFTWLILLFLKSSKKDLFTWLGKISYSFYLIHVPVGGKIINFSVNFIESSGFRIAVIFFALFTSLFLSYIFYRLIELPAINLSHLIIKKNKSNLNG
ncbi:MAG: acyltransferase [Pedobacter sp.]|nr:MAG: acyltransferase [Pedobacter sp.]